MGSSGAENTYLPPILEVVDVKFEKGYATSGETDDLNGDIW